MTVIIPHQADELKLLEIQHSFLNYINNSCLLNNSVCFYETIPLWFKTKLNLLDKKELKEQSKSFKSLTVTEILFDKDSILLNATLIFVDESTSLVSLPLLKLYTPKNMPNKEEMINKEKINEEIKKIAKSYIPLSFKIFRLGNTEESNNSIRLQDEVWVKLK